MVARARKRVSLALLGRLRPSCLRAYARTIGDDADDRLRLPSRTAESLRSMLLDARRVELELVQGLSDAQMLRTRLHFVEPPICEIGHVGWFQEYWILRHLDG